ncbi:hypothetical protein PHLGIDRAFT_33880 [Phlebiopsis gigantea 11061_1 CR5-6]|uniref:Phytocyanin domain-containing protein n=1 Tax=Phlebiopsis gigantea (strain 11061_1 CR5-6) TaxID=745531 RepID=A0A0C3PSV6_PHLG1|nr:hypothetical protein PHLGIDRAFT_33880 [Phlebiopsis gigantea 11061_1 CR5-6]
MKASFLSLVLVSLCCLVNAFTYTVTVGIDETSGHQGIGFDPSSIRPSAGDTITFTFALPEYLKDPPAVQHSATQSTFDAPCTSKAGGFDTGVQSTGSVNSGTGASFNLLVNDTNPIWFFSSVGTDCKSGMVLSINPPLSGDQTADAFLKSAMASTGTPSSSSPASSDQISSTSATSNAAASATSPAPQPTTSDTTSSGTHMAQVELGLAAIVAFIGVSLMAY